MKRMVMVAVAAVLMSGVLVALAQDKPATKDDGAKSMCPVCCNTCPACCNMTADGKMMDACKEIMKDAGITDEMMMQQKCVMTASMCADEPASLLGMAKGLNLTDDQKAKLAEIQKDARAKAAAVL
ncbi:MAG: hypothetical protein EHM48_02675, partial [Planctomycetaceae bacterium]